MSEQNKDTARRWIEEVWNHRKLGLCQEILAPDYRNHDPNSPDFGPGPENHKKLIDTYTTAFPDLHLTVHDVIAEGDKVVVRWTSSGTHKGELFGIAPAGKKIDLEGTTVCRFEQGKVAEAWAIWDTFRMMQQLGAIKTTAKMEHAA